MKSMLRGKRGTGRRISRSSRSMDRSPGAEVRRRTEGFSLLEMLLVVALIAATGVLAAAMLGGGLDRLKLKSSAQEIASQLRYTRAHAIATGVPQQFAIDPAAHAWQAPSGRHGQVPERLAITFTGAREVQSREDEGVIMFFGDGASTGGRVQLELRGVAWNVDVAWLTGEVSLRRAEQEG
ncbi:GspH/FimT family pseudopilin [soil metagenome]